MKSSTLKFSALALFAAAVLLAPAVSMARPPQADATAEAAAKLNKRQFHQVRVQVQDGIATLTGTVDVYEHKSDAERAVRKVKGVAAVRNLIEVGGPNVSDAELKDKLSEKLTYDRVGYGNAFDAITINVTNGVVYLGGHTHDYVAKDSAIALVSTYPGVKDVVADMEVDPTSIMDDQTRIAVYRAVYGAAQLNRYAIDPAKPIRISVQNGHVELYGVVDSQADKDVAFIKANGVPGVFTVKNYIVVAGQPQEMKKN